MPIELNQQRAVTANSNIVKSQEVEPKKDGNTDSKLPSWATGKNIGIGAAALSVIVVGGLLLHGKLSSKAADKLKSSTKTILREDGALEKTLKNGNKVVIYPKQVSNGHSMQIVNVLDKDGNVLIERTRKLTQEQAKGLNIRKFNVLDRKVGQSPENYDQVERYSKKVYNNENVLVESSIGKTSHIHDKNGVMTININSREFFNNEEKILRSSSVRENDTITTSHLKQETFMIDENGNKTLKEMTEYENVPHGIGKFGDFKTYHSETYVEPNKYDVFNVNINENGTHYSIKRHSQTSQGTEIAGSEVTKNDIPVDKISPITTELSLKRIFS